MQVNVSVASERAGWWRLNVKAGLVGQWQMSGLAIASFNEVVTLDRSHQHQ
ncbi:MAG: hypothetical protein AAF268_09445 [Cyanobacteria bacterium P01_A01_bin.3]